ncbi:MAG TPA: response regulator [Kofleriaceae bacterium]|nr:response regulator [Kofleriaceae bacterium]
MDTAAILIAPNGPSGPLRGLVDRLASVGVTVTIVEELAMAVDLVPRHETLPALLLDLLEADGEVEGLRAVTDAVRRVLAVLPNCLPVAITNEADPRLIMACVRAGAADVIDLALEGTATARAVVQRICLRQRERSQELDLYDQQRAIIEDLLKDLIRTERRSIDAEEALAIARVSREIPSAAETRPPSILLVEHEREVADELADLLEAAGIATFAYVTGEEALREAETLAGTTGLDLALVAAQLPGMDGLESIRRLRELVPGLPAFLMTSVHDADLAEDAADLGVVGFVHKPLEDIEEVVDRLAQLARDALSRTREHTYLERIKERHERVLARYRSLPRTP